MISKLSGSLLLIAVGLYLIISGAHSLHEVEAPKQIMEKVSDFFTHNPMWNPIIEFFGGTPQSEPAPPYHPSRAYAIVGIVVGSLLTLSGAAIAFLYRKRSD